MQKPENYKARYQWCGKTGIFCIGTPTGGAPNATPVVLGQCPSNPSGAKTHAPRWEKA